MGFHERDMSSLTERTLSSLVKSRQHNTRVATVHDASTVMSYRPSSSVNWSLSAVSKEQKGKDEEQAPRNKSVSGSNASLSHGDLIEPGDSASQLGPPPRLTSPVHRDF